MTEFPRGAEEPARKIARTVAANTGGKQSDTIDEVHLRGLVCGPGGLSSDQFTAGLADSLEAGWIEQVNDRFRANVRYHEL